MTALADLPKAGAGTASVPYFWQTLALTALTVMAISLPNLADPMIRWDDYPAYFADPSGFWAKTLHEGRWVNYLWHLREVVTPAWLNFTLYQLLWAGFAACLAVTTTRNGWFAAVLALLILVAPPATLISLWFNTLIPGLALVAFYALLGTRLSAPVMLALMPVFVVATFMAYTTYPLLILAVVLAQSRSRGFWRITGVLAAFTASFALAVLTVYAINWQIHGIFGVPLADWRDATPAGDLAGLRANLPLLWDSLTGFLQRSSFEFTPAIWFHLGLLTIATLTLIRHAPREALALHAGLWTGMALVTAQVLKMGAIVPPRGFVFAWVFYALIVTRAAQILTEKGGWQGRMARNAVLLIVGSYLLQTFQQYTTYRGWQATTADIAATIDAPVIGVQGDILTLPSAKSAHVQNERALAFRLQQLGGPQVIFCGSQTCDGSLPRLEVSASGSLRLIP